MTETEKEMPIYLDYQATTPTDPRVVAAMLPWFTEKFGNPHSRDHKHGWVSEEGVEDARGKIAALIGATAKEIVFTSGATESNNLAIKGVAEAVGDDRRHIVTCVTEHKCVLESCRRMEERGFEVTWLPVRPDGLIDLDQLSDAVTERTALVSIMTVNNEIGTVQPVAEIGRICRARGAKFHTDAAQAVGKVPVDVNAMNIDLLSISGHKVYGPKGIGALYVCRRPRVRITAQIDGGGQERGIRSGTVPTPLAVGLGEACSIATAEMADEATRLSALRTRFLERLREAVPDVHLHGGLEHRIPGNLNFSFPDIEGQDLMMRLTGLSVSTGSACTSAAVGPSHVLSALGVDPRLLHNALRIGLGRFTTEDEVDRAVEMIAVAVRTQRSASQLYERA